MKKPIDRNLHHEGLTVFRKGILHLKSWNIQRVHSLSALHGLSNVFTCFSPHLRICHRIRASPTSFSWLESQTFGCSSVRTEHCSPEEHQDFCHLKMEESYNQIMAGTLSYPWEVNYSFEEFKRILFTFFFQKSPHAFHRVINPRLSPHLEAIRRRNVFYRKHRWESFHELPLSFEYQREDSGGWNVRAHTDIEEIQTSVRTSGRKHKNKF